MDAQLSGHGPCPFITGFLPKHVSVADCYTGQVQHHTEIYLCASVTARPPVPLHNCISLFTLVQYYALSRSALMYMYHRDLNFLRAINFTIRPKI